LLFKKLSVRESARATERSVKSTDFGKAKDPSSVNQQGKPATLLLPDASAVVITLLSCSTGLIHREGPNHAKCKNRFFIEHTPF
jgi:hypothetical protein